jgi:hypothetical protein
MISLSEAAVTAPNLSAAVIRRNLLMHESPTKTIGVQHHHSVSRSVRRACKNMTAKQLGSVIMDDCFGATDFCSRRAWPELVHKHNDPTDDYHLSLYEDVVIEHEMIACRDIVRINLSSVWMLANALRAIVAGWNFSSVVMSQENFVLCRLV